LILEEKYTLSNGVTIPKLGLGTWFIGDEIAAQAVCDAVETGYRHIDSAQAYGNEKGVGKGIPKCGIAREKLFITTKLAAEVKDYRKATDAIKGSLQALSLDYIDLMLIHSPQPWMKFGEEDRFFKGNKEAWRALEEAYKAGLLRSIGVSNFEKVDLDNILASCSVAPMVDQVLVHVSNTPFELIKYTQSKGILIEAFSPIAHGALLQNQMLKVMAEKYRVTVPQLCIRYDLQIGTLPLPKSANPQHIRINAQVDFVISNADMELLKNMEHIKDYGEASHFPVFGGKKK